MKDQRLAEGAKLNLLLKVEPVNDPTMKIQWLLNGQSITNTGSRIWEKFDFGLISLIINGIAFHDAGEYAVIVRNQLGTATSKCRIFVDGKKLVTENYDYSV